MVELNSTTVRIFFLALAFLFNLIGIGLGAEGLKEPFFDNNPTFKHEVQFLLFPCTLIFLFVCVWVYWKNVGFYIFCVGATFFYIPILVAYADNFHFHDARVHSNTKIRDLAAGCALLITATVICLAVGLPTEKELFESKPPHESAPRRTRRTTMLLAIFTVLCIFVIIVLIGNAVEKDTDPRTHDRDASFLLRGMSSGVLCVFVLLYSIYNESRIWDGIAIFQVGHSLFSVVHACTVMKGNVGHFDQAAAGFSFLTILLVVLFVASLLHAEPGYAADAHTGGHDSASYQSVGAAAAGGAPTEGSALSQGAF